MYYFQIISLFYTSTDNYKHFIDVRLNLFLEISTNNYKLFVHVHLNLFLESFI
jgi:hypothetical protein